MVPSASDPAASPATDGAADERAYANRRRFRPYCVVNALAAILGSSVVFALPPTPARAADTCPNGGVRDQQGSAYLADCRAYELVTPQDTNAQTPRSDSGIIVGIVNQPGDYFNRSPSTTDGDSFMWSLFFSTLPGTDGNGWSNAYRAQRGPDGWSSTLAGPTGVQASTPGLGGYSADQGYQEFGVPHLRRYSGTLDLDPSDVELTSWIRYPDGTFHLVGEGTVPASPDNDGYPDGFADYLHPFTHLITPDASHIVFETLPNDGLGGGADAVPLTADAPPAGIRAVYDRTPTGLHLVSLLPGDVTPSSASDYAAAADDGSVVAFINNGNLYARVNDSLTETVASGNFAFSGTDMPAGVSGGKVFYTQSGDLFRFDTGSQTTDQINASGDATFVNISPDGSHVYFLSSSRLDGSKGTLGADNLYVWNGSTTTFIATVDHADLTRGFNQPYGLDHWEEGVTGRSMGFDFTHEASRLTPDGTTFVFESSAQLTPYDNSGHVEIYLYRTADQSLVCVSCNPSNAPASSDAALADYSYSVVGTGSEIQNITDDGHTVFFQTADALLPADSDGTTDVYEWHDGQLSLISSGQSAQPNVIAGITPSGHDVYFETSDRLIAAGQDQGVPAIYDARVDGGFTSPSGPAPCVDDACQGSPSSPPAPLAASVSFSGPSNATPSSPVGKPKVLTTTVRGTTFLVKVNVPTGGRIAINGSGIKAVRESIAKAGTYRLRLTLTAEEKRLLARKHKLKLKLRVSYTASGSSLAMTVSLMVKPAISQKSIREARRAISATGRAGK